MEDEKDYCGILIIDFPIIYVVYMEIMKKQDCGGISEIAESLHSLAMVDSFQRHSGWPIRVLI